MKVTQTAIADVLVIEPRILEDNRGHFFECYSRKKFAEIGIGSEFIQDNQSRSSRNVVRGLHYQIQNPQGKLIRAIAGEIFDVVVDLRRSSPTFGRWVGEVLSAENHRMLWVPRGFAHGFSVLSEIAEVAYKVDNVYSPEHERTLLWNDPGLAIPWRVEGKAVLGAKDVDGVPLSRAEVFA
jgi:dTDP-4-dehydrorhamnose 3,5-epimerase